MQQSIQLKLYLLVILMIQMKIATFGQVGFGTGGADKFLKVEIKGNNRIYENENASKLTAKTFNFNRVTEYKWMLNKSKIGSNQNALDISKLKPGKYQIQVIAINEKGYNVKSNLFTLTVLKQKAQTTPSLIVADTSNSNENNLSVPLVHIYGINVSKESASQITLRAEIMNDVEIESYKWEQVEGHSLNLGSKYSNEIILRYLKPGAYKFKVEVKGRNGQSAVAEHSLLIQANTIINTPPVVTTNEARQTITLPVNSARIVSIAFDEDGSVSTYLWEQISGGYCKLGNTHAPALSISDLRQGYYTFRVTVKDNQGLTASTLAEIVVKSPSSAITPVPALPSNSKPHPRSKLKGGPSNALLNLLLPGLGHYKVSGDFKGKNKNGSVFLITLAYLGSAGGSVYYKIQSDKIYKKYTDLATQIDIQRDASGNITGSRGLNEMVAQDYYISANDANKNAKTLAYVGAGIFASDFIYTLIKGINNQKKFNRFYSTQKSISYNPKYKQVNLGLRVNF